MYVELGVMERKARKMKERKARMREKIARL